MGALLRFAWIFFRQMLVSSYPQQRRSDEPAPAQPGGNCLGRRLPEQEGAKRRGVDHLNGDRGPTARSLPNSAGVLSPSRRNFQNLIGVSTRDGLRTASSMMVSNSPCNERWLRCARCLSSATNIVRRILDRRLLTGIQSTSILDQIKILRSPRQVKKGRLSHGPDRQQCPARRSPPDGPLDIAVEGGKIAAIGPGLAAKRQRFMTPAGGLSAPG